MRRHRINIESCGRMSVMLIRIGKFCTTRGYESSLLLHHPCRTQCLHTLPLDDDTIRITDVRRMESNKDAVPAVVGKLISRLSNKSQVHRETSTAFVGHQSRSYIAASICTNCNSQLTLQFTIIPKMISCVRHAYQRCDNETRISV